MSLLDKPGVTSFNIGTGSSYSVKQVLCTAEKVCGQHIPVVVRDRRPEIQPCSAEPRKLIKVLGWKPEHSIWRTLCRPPELLPNMRHITSIANHGGSGIIANAASSIQRDELLRIRS